MNIRCLDCGGIVREGDVGPCPPGCPHCGGNRIEGDENPVGTPRTDFPEEPGPAVALAIAAVDKEKEEGDRA